MADDIATQVFARACGETPAGGAPAVSPDFLGAVTDLDFKDYLATPAVSKSSLWTLHTRSPAHARVEREESNAMKLGTAIHCAILEPEEFELRFMRGPEDRRGTKWKEAICEAEDAGVSLLTAGDYDDAMVIRDRMQRRPLIRRLTGAGTVREVSCFWIDEPTGLRCRARPDAYVPGLGLMVDLKTTTDARAAAWRRRAVEPFGYHAQEAIYTEGGRACGMNVDAFVFVVVETVAPFEVAVYELAPDAVEEGRAIMRAARDRWAECVERSSWPGYPDEIQPLELSKWAFSLTEPDEAVG